MLLRNKWKLSTRFLKCTAIIQYFISRKECDMVLVMRSSFGLGKTKTTTTKLRKGRGKSARTFTDTKDMKMSWSRQRSQSRIPSTEFQVLNTLSNNASAELMNIWQKRMRFVCIVNRFVFNICCLYLILFILWSKKFRQIKTVPRAGKKKKANHNIAGA